MKNHRRIAIADRSALAHNIYKMILKPLGFTLFPYKTLRDLKENLDFKRGGRIFLINSNTFGKYFENHLEWLQKSPALRSAHKIFLCEPEEENIHSQLKALPRSHLVFKPFYPTDLGENLKRLLR